jgi:hypothetical protein
LIAVILEIAIEDACKNDYPGRNITGTGNGSDV